MTTTTNMDLVLPDPEITLGPTWAELLNAALELIDAHDHTDGKGALITPAGMDINTELDMQSHDVEDASGVSLIDEVSSRSDAAVVYRIGSNLWYNNAASVPVQITDGNNLSNPGSGALAVKIPGAYPYTVISGDAQKVVIVSTASARTINLPAALTAMFFILKDGSSLAQTNVITVVPNGTDTIDGVNSNYLIDWNNASIGLISDGVSKWYVV